MELKFVANDFEDLKIQVAEFYFAVCWDKLGSGATMGDHMPKKDPQKPKKEKAEKAKKPEPAPLPPVEPEEPTAPPEYTEMQVRDILSKIMYQHGSEPEAFERGKKEMQAVIARHGVRLSVIQPHQYKDLVEDAARSYPHLYEVKHD